MLVATEALSVLSEATEDESCLKMMIDVKPQLSHLGYKGALLFARFLSDVEGFRQLRAVGDVDKELDKWHKVTVASLLAIAEDIV
jgi:rapamycin-insensitive companion of mTOR